MAQFIPMAIMAVGAVQQGNAAKQAGDFNAGMLEQGATATLQQSGQNEVMQRRSAQIAMGDQAAAMGEAGVAGSSTSEAVQRQSSVNAELDALGIRYKGKLGAYGYRQQGALTRMEGEDAQRTSYLRAGASLLSGASKYW